jgi:hypothetical protein
MNGREKVNRALAHSSGPVPIDFGGGPTSGIHCSVVENLRQYYGLPYAPVKVHEPFQMLGYIDDDLKEVMSIDVEPLWNPYTMFGFMNHHWKEWKTPWGQKVLVSEDFRTSEDEVGNVYLYPAGDASVSPSGKMPNNGFFFDALVRQPPIDEDNLDPEDNLEEFGPVGEDVLEYLGMAAEKQADSPHYLFGNFGGTAIGDIALIPGLGLKDPKGIRDITEWYISTVSRRDYLHDVFSRETDIALENLEKIHRVVGDIPGLAYICGTDFGTQSGQFCSPETYRELYHPYYKRINSWIHENTGWKTFKHSCGAVAEFMPLFIESGFDIINPVQLSAAGMNARDLKSEYGEDLVFWGGGIDTQKTLPFGTPDEIRAQVLERCEILSQNGGFVFNSIHNVLAKTPVKNLVTMIDAVHEFNGSD